MRILVADQDTTSRRTLATCLEDLGHECKTAGDGLEAWKQYLEFAPEVVVTDRSLPHLDGRTLCRRIRAADTDGYTYVILLSAHSHREDALDGMRAGADDYLLKSMDPADLAVHLVAAERVTRLHEQLRAQRHEMRRLNEQLHLTARTDTVTGMGNRLRLHEDLATVQGQARRYGRRFSAAMLDLDHFKSFNDTYGHTAGDQALAAVGGVVRRECRLGDSVYRYGGEEFLCLFPEQAQDVAAIAAERIRAAVRSLGIVHGDAAGGVLTVSIGVADLTEALCNGTVDDAIEHADRALYRAKDAGRDRVVLAP